MNTALFDRLTAIAQTKYTGSDPAHDFSHVMRVVANVKYLDMHSGGDANMSILLPAALFHDIVKHDVRDARTKRSAFESAYVAADILQQEGDFPVRDIPHIAQIITEHSFTANQQPSSFESALLQDADRLDAIGGSGIMRAHAMVGHMNNNGKGQKECLLYHPEDPFFQNREPDPKNNALDFLIQRHELTLATLNTDAAKKMAQQRIIFFWNHLQNFSQEIGIPLPAKAKSRYTHNNMS